MVPWRTLQSPKLRRGNPAFALTKGFREWTMAPGANAVREGIGDKASGPYLFLVNELNRGGFDSEGLKLLLCDGKIDARSLDSELGLELFDATGHNSMRENLLDRGVEADTLLVKGCGDLSG